MAILYSGTGHLVRGIALAATVTASLGAMTVASTTSAEAAPHRHFGGGHFAGHRFGGFHHHFGAYRFGRHFGGYGFRHRGFVFHRYGFGVRRFAYGVGRPLVGYGGRLCPIGYHHVYGFGCRPNGVYGYVHRPVRIVRPVVIGGPIYHRVYRPLGYGIHRFGYGVHRFGYGLGRHFGGYGHGFRHVGFGGHPFHHAGFGGHHVIHRR